MTVIITQREDTTSLALRFRVCSALTSVLLMTSFHAVIQGNTRKILETSRPAVFNDKTPRT